MWPSTVLRKKISILQPLAEEIEGNGDLLMIILVRLPARSIFRFRCVSKRWNNISYTPFFFQAYYNIRKARSRMLAYIQITGSRINFLPVSPNDHNIDTSYKLDLHFVNSSNGVILFESRHMSAKIKYHILNPLTNKSVPLPPNEVLKFPIMTLMCEENAEDIALSYKVIAADLPIGSTLVMEIFSSNTCEWTTSKLTGIESFHGPISCYALAVDGIIHWLTHCQQVVVYDSNQEIAEPSLQMIQLPCQFNGDLRLSRASRNDPLWLCANIKTHVRIWMLPDTAEREWVLMHDIDYQPLRETIISKGGSCYSSLCYSSSLWTNLDTCTLLAGMIPWESPLVALLNMGDVRLVYHVNLESMTYEQVQFPVHEGPIDYMFYPYMEPISLSSYTF